MKKSALTIIVLALAVTSVLHANHLGILGKKAPEFGNLPWFDVTGKEMTTIKLSDYRGKVVYLDFFQSWCPGCLKESLPRIKVLSDKYRDNPNVKFLAIQTVFEGFFINTKSKVQSIRERYGLKFPMAHDDGSHLKLKRSALVSTYRSGGTPWTVIIDPDGKVVFNQFHISMEEAERLIESSIR